MENEIKYQSEIDYKIGTILFDDDTGEVFEVVKCVRIGIFEKFNYGLILKKVKRLQ